MSTPKILLFGASGRTGQYVIEACDEHPQKPYVYSFVRDSTKLSEDSKQMSTDIIQGDATNPQDIARVLEETEADHIIICLGASKKQAKENICEQNAKAISQIISNGSAYEHIKVIVISAVGAGDSRMTIGCGIGSFYEYCIRNRIEDHHIQEDILMGLNTRDINRVMVVRATKLTQGKASGKTELFEGDEKTPTMKIDREDLAKWVVRQICDDTDLFGLSVNITNYKDVGM